MACDQPDDAQRRPVPRRRESEPAPRRPEPRPHRPAPTGREEPVLPDVTRDERELGWGDEPGERDDEWYRRERPPHHE
jgi:hypothetical protein